VVSYGGTLGVVACAHLVSRLQDASRNAGLQHIRKRSRRTQRVADEYRRLLGSQQLFGLGSRTHQYAIHHDAEAAKIYAEYADGRIAKIVCLRVAVGSCEMNSLRGIHWSNAPHDKPPIAAEVADSVPSGEALNATPPYRIQPLLNRRDEPERSMTHPILFTAE